MNTHVYDFDYKLNGNIRNNSRPLRYTLPTNRHNVSKTILIEEDRRERRSV